MKLAYVAVLAAVLNVAGVHAADELDAIEAKMKALWDGFKSMSYFSEMKADSSSDQFSYKMESSGTTEMVRVTDKKWKMRTDGKMFTTQKLPGQAEQKTESYTQMISDGDVMYTYTESQGEKSASKMKVPDNQDVVGDSSFKHMRPNYDLKVLPDETVDGASCWVIEARSKQKDTTSGPMKYYISKDHGMMVQMIITDPAGKVTSLTKMKDIKVNPALADSRFAFTPPAGVTVVDSDAANAAAQQQIAAAQAQAAEAQKKNEEEQKKADEAAKKEEPAKAETATAKEEPAKTEPAKTETAKTEEPKKKEEKKDTKTKIKKGFGF
jgi:outer membrane lipoprotein-sorting protein